MCITHKVILRKKAIKAEIDEEKTKDTVSKIKIRKLFIRNLPTNLSIPSSAR